MFLIVWFDYCEFYADFIWSLSLLRPKQCALAQQMKFWSVYIIMNYVYDRPSIDWELYDENISLELSATNPVSGIANLNSLSILLNSIPILIRKTRVLIFQKENNNKIGLLDPNRSWTMLQIKEFYLPFWQLCRNINYPIVYWKDITGPEI